jgi:hypothetical protein
MNSNRPPQNPAPEPRCPYCGEDKLIDVEGFVGYCKVCGKTLAVPQS